MANINDVAKLAGVSPITVSRALNKPNLVKPDTLRKVQQAAAQLDYQPNFAARGLRTGQTRIIMLVVNQKLTYDPLLFEFATGVSESCRMHGYSLLIYPNGNSENSLDDLLGNADALILTDIADHDTRIEGLLGQIPIAIFGQSHHPITQVDIDDAWGARAATHYLLELGYRDIVMVTCPDNLLYVKHRMQGYSNRMIEAGELPMFTHGSLDVSGGELAMASLGRLPEAVFCVADVMAIGVQRYLHARGMHLPVVGYDGGYLGEITSPHLTSVKQPFYAAGEQLAEAMIKQLQSGQRTRRLIRPTLIVRESTWSKVSKYGKALNHPDHAS